MSNALELSVTLGDIITVGAILSGGLIAWGAMRGTVLSLSKDFVSFTQRTEAQFDDIKAEMHKLNDVMIMIAESKGRMDRMDDRAILQGSRIDELSKRFNDYLDNHRDSRQPNELR